MAGPTECDEVADLLAEVATGTAGGPDRARVLRHLSMCDACRQELDALTRVADEVLLVAPARETPAGFEGAVLARMSGEGQATGARGRVPPWTRRRTILVAAAAAAVFAAGAAAVVWQSTSADRDLAASYRATLDVAGGRYFSADTLTGPGGATGTVFAYEGDPSWLFVVVETAPAGAYDVIVTEHGRSRTVATCTVAVNAGCSAGATLDASLHDLDGIALVAADGTTLRTSQGG